jgi:hypothetical protein
MFAIEREDENYEHYEEDPGEEHIQYKGRLLRCADCQQPVPVMDDYDGLFVIVDAEAEELVWTWQYNCSGKEAR